jgi:hypothetical protein
MDTYGTFMEDKLSYCEINDAHYQEAGGNIEEIIIKEEIILL